eukprot:6672025-Pyramimonas_sp.AAC.1
MVTIAPELPHRSMPISSSRLPTPPHPRPPRHPSYSYTAYIFFIIIILVARSTQRRHTAPRIEPHAALYAKGFTVMTYGDLAESGMRRRIRYRMRRRAEGRGTCVDVAEQLCRLGRIRDPLLPAAKHVSTETAFTIRI